MSRRVQIARSMDRQFPIRPGGCSACAGPLPKRRQRWCSNACAELFERLNSPFRGRKTRYREDPHCALCRCDVWVLLMPGEGWLSARDRGSIPLAELDHIVPLAEGGEHEWSNLRLLCVPCHRSETASLAARLAARRRSPP